MAIRGRTLIALLLLGLLLHGTAAQSRSRSQALQSDNDDDDADVTLGGSKQTGSAGSAASVPSDDDDDADVTLGADAPAPPSPPSKASRRAADADDDEDEAPLDPDEFEGATHPPAPSRPAPSTRSSSAPTGAPSAPREAEPESDDLFGIKYLLEATAISLITVYAIIFFIGRSTNDGIAKAWFGTFRPVFEAQFAAVGAYGASTGVQAGPALLKDSENVYKFYASGRRHCIGALCTIELIKRHDLLSHVLALFDLAPTRDTLTVEIPMSPEDMEPFVFAVMPRKHEKRIRKAVRDLDQFTVAVPSRKLPASLSVLTDCPELEEELVDELIARTLTQHEELFASLHLSDQHEGPTAKVFPQCKQKILKFTFNLPANRDMARLLKLTEMALYFVDRVAALKLSPAAAARSAKKRKEIADAEYRASHDQRQEAAQRRKEEQKKKDEEALAKLTPEQLKKREAKEQKLALKKKTPKVKIMR